MTKVNIAQDIANRYGALGVSDRDAPAVFAEYLTKLEASGDMKSAMRVRGSMRKITGLAVTIALWNDGASRDKQGVIK